MSIGTKEYEYIRKLVYEHSRINLGSDKHELVSARLGKRLRATGISSIKDYCQYLDSPAGEDELEDLINVISTNHTFFFREYQHFEFLQRVAMTEMVSYIQAKNDIPFRLWSAASSTGEEPYSLAIFLSEYFTGQPAKWEIQATDISTHVLNKARNGVFAEERLKEVKPDLMKRYFQRGVGRMEGYFRIKEEFRSKVNFQPINLLQPVYPFQKQFHVIFCRNVMIYFDRPTQEELVAKLTDQLVPGGYLMIGHSESLTSIRHGLKIIQPAVYQKAGAVYGR